AQSGQGRRAGDDPRLEGRPGREGGPRQRVPLGRLLGDGGFEEGRHLDHEPSRELPVSVRLACPRLRALRGQPLDPQGREHAPEGRIDHAEVARLRPRRRRGGGQGRRRLRRLRERPGDGRVIVAFLLAQATGDVFVSGQDGYHTFRIPSVVVTAKGTVLAFCEGRVKSRSDTGDIDL